MHPTIIAVHGRLERSEAQLFAAALQSLAAEPVAFVSFLACSYVDMAALAALVRHEAKSAAGCIVIVAESGFVRTQFRLSGLDCRLGVVVSIEEARERASRLLLLADIDERARASRPLTANQ